ncbi:MAG TPA: hypothetical protein VNZ23_04840 [Xanthobacteraceae bacterium]|nr:hypothetical protein [Xanthobacteraceae bacterium]
MAAAYSLFVRPGQAKAAASSGRNSAIHHLGLYSIQMLANPATIIYWNRGGWRESNRQKRALAVVPDRGYFLTAKCAPPPFSRRIVFRHRGTPHIGMFTICGCRTLESGYRTLERRSEGVARVVEGLPG